MFLGYFIKIREGSITQINEEQKLTQKEPIKLTTKKRRNWWLISIVILVVLVIAASLGVWFSFGPTSQTTAPKDTTEEITIKQYISSLRGDIVRFGEEKKTYEGWTPNVIAVDQVKKMGSKLKTQALTKDTYVIYASLPTSKKIFCMDNNGFTGQISYIFLWQKTCK